MSILSLIVVLLVVVVLLLCRPQAERPAFLLRAVLVGGGVLAAYYIVPAVIGFLFAAGQSGFDFVRWLLRERPYALLGTLVLFFVGGLVVAGLLDVGRNRAIRAGSTEAFDKRVRELMEMQNLSYEEAVESATRIRDGS